MKKLVTLGAALLATVTLTACGSSSSKTDNGGKTTTAKKATTTTSKSSSSKSDSKEVTNGQLLKVGQWKNDDMQGRMKLVNINTINKTISSGSYSVTLVDYKLFEITPKNDDQKQTATDAFGSSDGVTTPYYEAQIQYSIKNGSGDEVQFNGFKSIVTTSGTQLDPNDGMSDQGSGETVAAGATKSTAVQLLIPTAEKDKLTSLTLNFDSFCTTTDYQDLATLPTTTLNLK